MILSIFHPLLGNGVSCGPSLRPRFIVRKVPLRKHIQTWDSENVDDDNDDFVQPPKHRVIVDNSLKSGKMSKGAFKGAAARKKAVSLIQYGSVSISILLFLFFLTHFFC